MTPGSNHPKDHDTAVGMSSLWGLPPPGWFPQKLASGVYLAGCLMDIPSAPLCAGFVLISILVADRLNTLPAPAWEASLTCGPRDKDRKSVV